MTKGAWIVVAGVVSAIVVYELSNSLGAGDSVSNGSGAGAIATVGSDINSAIASAMASFENVNPAHNNPGGLGTWIGGVFNVNNYSTMAQGVAAQTSLVAKFLAAEPGITVSQFVRKWEEGDENGSISTALGNYIQHVASELGIGANDPIASGGGDGGGDGGDDDSTDDGGDDDF